MFKRQFPGAVRGNSSESFDNICSIQKAFTDNSLEVETPGFRPTAAAEAAYLRFLSPSPHLRIIKAAVALASLRRFDFRSPTGLSGF